MSDEKISPYQLGMIMTAFFIGSSLVINPSVEAKQDAWIAFIVSWIGGMLLFLITLAIAQLHPGKTLVGIFIQCFGKIGGKILSIIYAWYFLHLSAEVIRSYANYSTTVSYPETPLLFFLICYTFVVAYALKIGLETIGRISEIFIPFILMVIVFTFAASIGSMDMANFKPILSKGFSPVLRAALPSFIVPFGEIFIFLMVFSNLNNQKQIPKVVIISNLLIGSILLFVICRNLLVLGADMLSRDIYPAHIVYRLIPVIDVAPLLDINLILASVTKTAVCIYATAKIISEVFTLNEYKMFILPLCAFAVSLSMILYQSLMQQIAVTSDLWVLYSIPFQVIIPIIVLIISILKKKFSQIKEQSD